MSKVVNIIFLIGLVLILGVLLYKVYEILPQESQNLKITLKGTSLPESNASKELSMFVPNLRMKSNKVSYYFFNDCELTKKERTLYALKIISEKTGNIFFYELNNYDPNNKPDITIYCSEIKKETGNNTIIAGEGGPHSILNSSLYPLILGGEMYLYGDIYNENCDYPVVELHELMHVFGFEHINNKSAILYPFVSCDQRLTKETISELKRLYSIPAEADIYISEARASKAGIYLNFELKISNRGILDAKNVVIHLYDQDTGKKIESFELEDVPVGTSKTLNIANLMLPSKQISNINFKITTETPEYFYENNEISAELEKT